MTEPKPKWGVGEQLWKVIPFVDDVELEATLNALEADGFCPVSLFRNSAGDCGRESTTVVATLFEKTEQSCCDSAQSYDDGMHGIVVRQGGN